MPERISLWGAKLATSPKSGVDAYSNAAAGSPEKRRSEGSYRSKDHVELQICIASLNRSREDEHNWEYAEQEVKDERGRPESRKHATWKASS